MIGPNAGAGVRALDQAEIRGGAWALRDVIVTDGIRYRMYRRTRIAPVAYANLARLKQSAADLIARMQRP